MTGQAHTARALYDIWRENRDELTKDTQSASGRLSGLLGIPVALVYFDQIPNSFNDPAAIRPFTAPEIEARAQRLAQDFARLCPDASYDWKTIAARETPRGFRCYEPARSGARLLPLRLIGDSATAQACILLNDRRWTPRQEWQMRTGLAPGQIERWPDNRLIQFRTFLHEVGHILQRYTQKTDFAQSWRMERDADSFAFTEMRRLGKGESTIAALKKARALYGFLGAPPRYWTALAFDAGDRHRAQPNPESCWLAGYELRLRVHARLSGKQLTATSQQIHKDLRRWKAAAPPCDTKLASMIEDMHQNWGRQDAAQALPALRDVLAAGDIADPQTRRAGTLALEAARYFCSKIVHPPEKAPPNPHFARGSTVSLDP